MTNSDKAFMASFKDTHNQYEIPDNNIEAFLCGTDESFDGYTTLADAYNLWQDAILFARGKKMKTYEVVIESVGRKVITIQANSADEAQDAAYDQWDGSTDGYADNSILSTTEVTE